MFLTSIVFSTNKKCNIEKKIYVMFVIKYNKQDTFIMLFLTNND